MAAGYQAYAGGGGKGGSGSPTGGGQSGSTHAAVAAAPSEDEVRAAEVALGRALHALHRTAGGFGVYDHLVMSACHQSEVFQSNKRKARDKAEERCGELQRSAPNSSCPKQGPPAPSVHRCFNHPSGSA